MYYICYLLCLLIERKNVSVGNGALCVELLTRLKCDGLPIEIQLMASGKPVWVISKTQILYAGVCFVYIWSPSLRQSFSAHLHLNHRELNKSRNALPAKKDLCPVSMNNTNLSIRKVKNLICFLRIKIKRRKQAKTWNSESAFFGICVLFNFVDYNRKKISHEKLANFSHKKFCDNSKFRLNEIFHQANR